MFINADINIHFLHLKLDKYYIEKLYQQKQRISVSSEFYLMHQMKHPRMNGNKSNERIRFVISKNIWKQMPGALRNNT
jgi:hypothetical protein